MPLRLRLLSLFVPLLLATVTGVWLLAQNTLVARFDRSDHEEINDRLQQLNRQLYQNLRHHLAVARDWAWWDDSFEFIARGNPEYIDSNLSGDTLANLNLHLVAYFDAAGKPVHTRWRKSSNHTLVTLDGQPAPSSQALQPMVATALQALRMQHSSNNIRDNRVLLVRVANVVMLAVQVSITPGEDRSTSNGALVMVRLLDKAWQEEMQSGLRTPILLRQAKTSTLPALPLSLPLDVQKPAITLFSRETPSEHLQSGWLRIGDAQHQAQFDIELSLPRQLYLQGQQSVEFFLICAFVLAGVGLLIGFLSFEYWVLVPIRHINRHIKRIAQQPKHRLPITGNDELTGVSRSINLMLDQRQDSSEREQLILDNIKDGYCELDAQGRLTRINHTMQNIIGASAEQLIGTHYSAMIPETLRPTAEHFFQEAIACSNQIPAFNSQYQRADGSLGHFEIRLSQITDSQDQICGLRGILRDTSRQEAYHSALLDLAYRDALTGVGNRKAFSERLQGLCHGNAPFALLFIDLDQFKPVNDRFGHDVGDQLLQHVAKRLGGLLRDDDRVFRLGGDEFTVVLPNTQREQAWMVAQRLLNRAGEDYDIDGTYIDFITPSIGLAMYPEDAQDSESLLRAADLAMYEAKQARNRVMSYSPALATSHSSDTP